MRVSTQFSVFLINKPGVLASVTGALSKAGVDMNQISALLLHSNVAVTKKHYAEPDMGVLKKVVDNVRAIK